MPMNVSRFIVRDPKVCGGEPTIAGTRVLLRAVLAELAQGKSVEAVMAAYPTLTAEAVYAVIAYAAESAREDLPMPPTPRVA